MIKLTLKPRGALPKPGSKYINVNYIKYINIFLLKTICARLLVDIMLNETAIGTFPTYCCELFP